jgi:hypothetical protein
MEKKQTDKKQKPWSPVADPIPPWVLVDPLPPWMVMKPQPDPWKYIRFAPEVDPPPHIYELLDKAKIARIKVAQLDIAIKQIQENIDYLKLQRDRLKEEYKL